MKKYYYLILLLLFSITDISAASEIFQLDSQKLTISGDIIQYDDYDNIILPNQLSLPYRTIYLPVSEFDNISKISVKYAESEEISSYANLNNEEIPTSLDNNLYTNVISSASFDRLGYNQIQVMDKITIADKGYLKCMFFPVTVDSSGQAFFHNRCEFQTGDKKIIETQFLTESQISEFQNTKTDFINISLSAAATQYIIITNENLAPSFEWLASYKNETGITTEIKLIDEILSQYTGRDDAEKLREFLKDFYASGGQYVLLGGDETVLPIRYTYHNIATGVIPLENQQVCDLYFSDLTGNWNADNDFVWGEKYTDSVDVIPELFVGRLPFNQPYEVSQYIGKLVQYETNQKQIDLSYLEKSFFFSSDQMRDYGATGQHSLIAEALPDYFTIDTTNGVEHSSGNDLNPTNLSSKELEPVLSKGFGIVNIIAHGSNSTFGVRTSNYNEWPKSYFTTDTNLTTSGIINNIDTNGRISLYVSLGCDNGAFDKDQPPFNQLNPNLVQTLLAQKNSGAVAFVANTRWGWVSTSHLLQKRFLEHLFANQNQPAIVSLYQMKNDYYYYRDLVYGINYFGDPTMIVHTKKPESISLNLQYRQNEIIVTATTNNNPLENTTILLSENSNQIASYRTDNNGQVIIDYNFDMGANYKVSALKDGFTINQEDYAPSIATDIDDNGLTLPTSYALEQNYPNPFNPSTIISFSLPKKTDITLQVFNMVGQEVKTIATGTYNAGIYNFEWDGKDNSGSQAATGVYLYRIETLEFSDTKKMLLLR